MERMNASVASAAIYAHKLLVSRPVHTPTDGAHGKTRIGAMLLAARALACVLLVSGCAGNAPQPETRSEPVRTPAQMCHIDRALLMSVHAPDCGFGRADLKTVDPDQWTHLKLEFERKCYQNAEKATRERLRRLQAAAKCEVESAQR
jgi:hypothetical protein